MATLASELSVTRVVPFDGEGSVKAFCDLTVGNALVIKGVKVVKGKRGLFVSMPRSQGKDDKWYDDVVPLSKDVRTEIGRVVLAAYEQASMAR